MNYRIAREEKISGPYTLLEVQRHLQAGDIVATDLAQGDGMDEWVKVEELFPAFAMRDERQHPAAVPRLFPDPPDLRWWIVLLLGVLTVNVFSIVWDVYEAAWMRRVDRRSASLYLYGAAALLFLYKLPETWHTVLFNLGQGPRPYESGSLLVLLVTLVIGIASRLTLRHELLRHFNGPEPLGLRLNWILSLLLGGLYFQFHFNRLNETKRALRISVP